MEKLEIILNKHKECAVYFCLTLLIKMCFLISIFVFCFGTEIGTENCGFSLVLVPNTDILVP